MAFPQSALPIKQELLIDGVWTDVTTRTRLDGEVRIQRGQSGDQSGGQLVAGTCNWTCDNPDNFFSGRVPTSVNYRKIGRNTQYRTSVTEDAVFLKMGDGSFVTGGYDGGHVRTADKGGIDVTGDIDIRIDVTADDWRGGRAKALISKYITTGNQRSWMFWIDRDGYPRFRWSSDGSAAHAEQATEQISFIARGALRVTLDVNNGAGGYTLTFYTAPSITGSWTQLGSQVVTTSGTTAVFSSTSPLMIGAIASTATTVWGRAAFGIVPIWVDPFIGRVHRAQLYSGIAGTLVADFNPGSRSAGDTSWSDGLTDPNTWIVDGGAYLTAQDFRFWGEIGNLPSEWDNTGVNVFGQLNSYDLASRLLAGSKTLHSTIYRNLIQYSNTASGTSGTMDGYWPMENGSQATIPTPAIGRYGTLSGAGFTTDEDFPGSEGVLSFNSDSGTATGGCVLTHSGTGTVTFLLYFRAPSLPAGTVDLIRFYMIGGTTYRTTLQVSGTTYNLLVNDPTNASLLSTSISFGTGAEPDQPIAMRIQLVQNGANVDYAITWYPIGAPVVYGSSGSYAGTVGKPNSWVSPAFTGKSGWWIAHVAMFRESIGFETYAFIGATNAYAGEHADSRFARLCKEEGVPWWVAGWPYGGGTLDPGSGSELMGAQRPQSFPALLQECARLDGGMIYGPRDKFGLTFRLRNSFFGQDPAELDYGQKHLSPGFKPREDLFFVRNDVTVTNSGGGAGRAVKTSGSLNVNEPSADNDGIGTYDPGPISREAYLDDRLTALAEEEVYLGTWDEPRFASVPVELARSCFTTDAVLSADVAAVDIGKAVRIVNPPDQLPPDDIELLVLGYSEALRNRGRPISWNTAPYGPYRAANNLTGSALFRARAAATPGNSTLSASLNSSASSFSVATASGKLWVTGSSAPTFPMEIMVGGEEMAVGSISGSTSPQTFSSVTRSVNGVVKAHDSGDDVQVRDVFYVAR